MKNRHLFLIFALVAVAGVAWFVMSRNRSAENGIVPSKSLIAAANPALSASSAGAAAPQSLSPRGTKAVRISSAKTITAAVRGELAEMGVRVIGPLSARAIFAEVTPEAARKVRAAGAFQVEDVVSSGKVQPMLAEMCAKTSDAIPVVVVGLSVEDRDTLRRDIVSLGGTLNKGPVSSSALLASVKPSVVSALSERGDVRWIEYSAPRKALNDLSVGETAANIDTIRSVHRLRGAGQVVTVCDTGLDNGSSKGVHADFAGRILGFFDAGGYGVADYNGHGTHVAGTALGDGSCSDGRYKGMAPKARLFVMGCGYSDSYHDGIYLDNCDTPEALYAQGIQYGSYVHSDSWGSECDGLYTADSRDLDEVTWNNPQLLVVVAAGNSGDGGSKTVGSPATAKNALTVGNGMSLRESYPTNAWGVAASPENLNNTSSRGPTADGRIKPEIVAPGTEIVSTLSRKSSCSPYVLNENYTKMSGTSMATPLVSGAAALVREWLQKRRNIVLPTGALVKAILTGGTSTMTGKGALDDELFDLPQETPNTDTGWGRINLEQTLYPTGGVDVARGVWIQDRIPFSDGSTTDYTVETTGDGPLDVQLAWYDHPKALGGSDADATIVNDLDLVVRHVSAADGTETVWYGNGVETGDRLNTVESVRITNSVPAGTLTISVVGHSVPYASNEGGAAALYVRGSFEDDTADDPKCVENHNTGKLYASIDGAVDEASDGDELWIVDDCELESSVTVNKSCTIVSTSKTFTVSRLLDSKIIVKDGKLTLRDVMFSSSSATLVDVSSNGCVRIEGGVDLGVEAGTASIVTTDTTAGFELAGTIANAIYIMANGALTNNAVFGKYDCDLPTAEASGAYVVNVADEDFELRAVPDSATGNLKWGYTPIPLDDAAGYFVMPDGVTNAYASTRRAFQRFASMWDAGSLDNDMEIVLCKSGKLEQSILIDGTSAIRSLTVRGGDGVVITASGAACFTVGKFGKMLVRDVTFTGEIDGCLFKVTDDGDLTLGKGAVLSEMHVSQKSSWKYGSVYLSATDGVLTLDHAVIEDCVSRGHGGGVCALQGTLNIFDSSISGCAAAPSCFGGGVYVLGKSTKVYVNLNLGGEVSVTGNYHEDNSGNRHDDDVYLGCDNVKPQIVRTLTGESKSLGVWYREGLAPNRLKGVFATAKTGEIAYLSAGKFFSDLNGELKPESAGTNLIWGIEAKDDGQCAPSQAKDLVIYGYGGERPVTNYYDCISTAVGCITNDATVVMLEETEKFRSDLKFPVYRVALRSALETSALARSADVGLTVVSGAVLTVCNVGVCGGTNGVPVGGTSLVRVQGGALTLADGASVSCVSNVYSQNAAAVAVWRGGEIVMERGSRIFNCVNDCPEGNGGGLYLSSATAHLRGGEISGCRAAHGAGVYAVNGSKLKVSGNFTAQDSFVEYGGEAQILLTDKLTGSVGVTRGLYAAVEKDVFGKVAYAGDVANLSASAAHFFKSDDPDEHGVIVTNGTESLLVWMSALTPGGKFTDEDGKNYYYVGEGDPRICPESDLSSACAKLVNPDGTSNWWYRVQGALAMATNGCIVEILKDDTLRHSVLMNGDDVLVRTDAALGRKAEISREPNISIVIPSGLELAITNVAFKGVVTPNDSASANALFAVRGGTLKFSGVTVRDVKGGGARLSSAVCVTDGGKFMMDNSSQIADCVNDYFAVPHGESSYDGAGGGLLVDDGTAFLHGGLITGCLAPQGGGVYVGRNATVFLSGDMRIQDNVCTNYAGGAVESSDISYAYVDTTHGSVVLDGVLDNRIGLLQAAEATAKCEGYIGSVEYDGDLTNLVASAKRLFNTERPLRTGVIVTNALAVRLVWSDSVKNGVYTANLSGTEKYYAVTLPGEQEEPEPDPEPEPEEPAEIIPTLPADTPAAVENALQQLTDDPDFKDKSVVTMIGGLEDSEKVAAYKAFKDWANTIQPDGEASVAASTNAAVSYAFGCTNLFENAPVVTFTSAEAVVDGGATGFDVTVTVTDGGTAHDVSPEKVKAMFEASADLSDWTLNVDVVPVSTEVGSPTEYKLTPGTGTETKAFIRLKY